MDKLLCHLRCRSTRAKAHLRQLARPPSAAWVFDALQFARGRLDQRPHERSRRSRLIRLALVLAFALIWGPVFAETVTKVAPQNPGEVRLSFAPVVKKVRLRSGQRLRVTGGDDAAQSAVRRSDIPPVLRWRAKRDSRVVQKSLGSGVIVDPSGLVVTNYHVIEGMTDVKVALSDKREFEAQILLRDPRTDLGDAKTQRSREFPGARTRRLWTPSKSEISSSPSAIRSASAKR